MLSYNQALKKVLDQAGCLKSEKVDISESLGRVLAEDIRAREDIPNFDRSAMDGYAVRACDVKTASQACPVCLKVLTDLPAGRQTRKKLTPGTAIRIMTGAPVPNGADSVVMVEYTRKSDAGAGCLNFVDILTPVRKEENVSRSGEDVKKDELVIAKGTFIRPAEIGMLASLGKAGVRVTRRPEIAVIPTGDEIKHLDAVLKKGQIRDSNSYSITALAVACGAQVKNMGIAGDSKAALLKKINVAGEADIIVLTGGVSVGDYDLVKDVLLETGVKMLFWKVKIKPGKPVFFGKKGKTLVFGLPGYPVSAMVTFQLFVRPVISAMLGQSDSASDKSSISPVFKAVLEEEITKRGRRRNFMRGRLKFKNGRVFVRPVGKQKSGILKSMLLADCLMEIPEAVDRLKPGLLVDVRPFISV